MKIKFYNKIDDEKLKFAVIVSRYKNQWVFCKHKERNTLEIPGGHREVGESILDAAKRELQEETSALVYSIEPISIYSVIGTNRVNDTDEETFGMLYFADIQSFDDELHHEIEEIYFIDDLPSNLTYPDIQPVLFYEVLKRKSMEG